MWCTTSVTLGWHVWTHLEVNHIYPRFKTLVLFNFPLIFYHLCVMVLMEAWFGRTIIWEWFQSWGRRIMGLEMHNSTSENAQHYVVERHRPFILYMASFSSQLPPSFPMLKSFSSPKFSLKLHLHQNSNNSKIHLLLHRVFSTILCHLQCLVWTFIFAWLTSMLIMTEFRLKF